MSISSEIICDGCRAKGNIPKNASMVFNGYRHLWRAYAARRRLSLLGWKHSKGAKDYCPACQDVTR